MKFPIAILALGAATTLAAQEAPVVREGAYWVGAVGDSFDVAPHASLQVNTRGNVVVRRAAGNQVTYRVRQSVIAANEEQARALLGGGGAQVSSSRGRVVLQLQPVSARRVETRIEIGVPPQVSAVLVRTERGEIHVVEFDGSVQLTTGGGEIRLGRIGGNVQCYSGAGQLVVERAGGAIDCTTVGGNIAVGDAAGAVTLSNQMGGNIRVEKAGGDVR